MRNYKSVGDYYAYLLEKHLNAAIQKKLDETSSFKKKLAGIESIGDAKAKGYAPDASQIEQVKTCVIKLANDRYNQPAFHQLPVREAIARLANALTNEIDILNEQWRKNKQFSFDKDALTDLAQEATELMMSEHDAVNRHFFR